MRTYYMWGDTHIYNAHLAIHAGGEVEVGIGRAAAESELFHEALHVEEGGEVELVLLGSEGEDVADAEFLEAKAAAQIGGEA